MVDHVIWFEEKKEEKEPHVTKPALCISCFYECVVVVHYLADKQHLECPKCHNMTLGVIGD